MKLKETLEEIIKLKTNEKEAYNKANILLDGVTSCMTTFFHELLNKKKYNDIGIVDLNEIEIDLCNSDNLEFSIIIENMEYIDFTTLIDLNQELNKIDLKIESINHGEDEIYLTVIRNISNDQNT